MATFELVEKLRQHANVSYEEAKAALDACGGDLLEAMILLEKSGKVTPPAGGGRYSSKDAPPQDTYAPKPPPSSEKGETFGQLIKRFFRWFGNLIKKGNHNHFEVWRAGNMVLSIPVTVLVLLLLCCFWVTLPLLVIGLFCGCRYLFRGAEIESTGMNEVMGSVADTAESIKTDVINASQTHQNMYNQQTRQSQDAQSQSQDQNQ